MKIINPVGRIPSNAATEAYGCTCNIPSGNYNAVSGNVPCNVCAFSCNGSNLQDNQREATSRQTHS